MASWDDDEFTPVIAPAKVEVPKNNWDDEDFELKKAREKQQEKERLEKERQEKEKEKNAQAAKNKEKEKEKEKETKPKETKPKEAKKEEKKEEKKEKEKEIEEEKEETDIEKKKRLEGLVRNSDFQNTQDLFANYNADLKTPEQFNELAKSLSDKLVAFDKTKEYLPFLERLNRGLTAHLKSDDVKRLATFLNAIVHEKQKEEKSKQQPAPKKKGALTKKAQVSVTGLDYEEDLKYVDENVDDYDFI